MKKIYLFLATMVAALSSCMEESALAPVAQDNKVTIKAVAGDTKTLLDGTSVVWEQGDKLAVLLKGEETTIVEFAAEGEVNGANATFTGKIAPELEYTAAYAVYPVSAYTVDGGVGKISHTLPETQTGEIKSGMNLSSTLLDAGKLKVGEAEGAFHNALTLLQVVVPAGVQSVSLHSSDDALVGTLTFNEPNEYGVLTRAENGTKRTVTLSTGSELAEGTHSLLVYPGIAHTLTLTMIGTDGAEYTSAVSEIRFSAGEYRTIDLRKIFNVATEELHVVLPAGGTVEVPVVTTDAFEYQVSLSSGAESWLTYELPTKSFHKETIVFNVAENTSEADRTATVTITYGEKSKTFRIQQKNIFMDFLNDENGDPIQWAETFSVYATKENALAGTNPTTYKNVFTIALSDDFTKGEYKISGMFAFNEIIYGSPVTPTYYANYVDGKLIVIQNQDGFYFQSDITFAYDAEAKTFTMTDPVEVGPRYNISGWQNKSGWIYGYNAAVKVEETPEIPEEGEGEDKGIVGTYSVTVGFKNNGTASTKTETITISENSDAKGQYKITGMFDAYGNGGGTYYANYADGILTVLAANADNMYIGPMTCGDIQMLHHGISFASTNGVKAGDYGYELTSYIAKRN